VEVAPPLKKTTKEKNHLMPKIREVRESIIVAMGVARVTIL
jgi:hypothetical protein